MRFAIDCGHTSAPVTILGLKCVECSFTK